MPAESSAASASAAAREVLSAQALLGLLQRKGPKDQGLQPPLAAHPSPQEHVQSWAGGRGVKATAALQLSAPCQLAVTGGGSSQRRPRLQEPSSIEKVAEVDSHIGVAMSGLTADARTLVDHARVESQVRSPADPAPRPRWQQPPPPARCSPACGTVGLQQLQQTQRCSCCDRWAASCCADRSEAA